MTVNYSLIGDTSGSGITAGTGVGNILNQSAGLGPLVDNGGPTLTHALLEGSLAIDAGNPSIDFDDNEFDQRGKPFFRVFDTEGGGARIDIGAFEVQTLPVLFVINNTADFDDGDALNGQLTLREAIKLANQSFGADTINFDTSLSGQTITLAGDEIEITEAITIDATSLVHNLTIDADDASRIFNFTATTGDFALSGLTLTGGNAAGDGGAIRSLSTGSLTPRTKHRQRKQQQ